MIPYILYFFIKSTIRTAACLRMEVCLASLRIYVFTANYIREVPTRVVYVEISLFYFIFSYLGEAFKNYSSGVATYVRGSILS